MKIKIIGVLIILSLLGIITYKENVIINIKKDRDTYKENTKSLLEHNSSINLTNKDLLEFIKNSESKFAQEIDSVTKKYDIKIKHLQKLIQIKNEVTEKDPFYLPPVEVIHKPDSTYILKYIRESECFKIEIEAITKDKNTLIKFNKIQSNSESYFLVYKEKKPWWKIFKKRKLMQKTVNNCGEVSIKELEIIK